MRKIILLLSFFLSTALGAQEICNNGIDDDGDGLIDLNDATDCSCSGFATSVVVPSMIPNPSFEQSNCCPTSYSQLNCATGWVQATAATSDYMNTCGFVFGAATNLGLVPPPNGNGFVGAIFSDGYQEYIGSCLLSPMLAGNNYNLTMSIASSYIDGSGNFVGAGAPPPVNITIFGNTNCVAMPLGGLGCPGAGWVPIAVQSYTPSNTWGLINITFTPPTNINSIIIGSPCVLPAGYNGANYGYFYFDNLILNETSFFNSVTIAETGSICGNDLKLTATPDSVGGTWQWYKSGIALVGQTGPQLLISANNLTPGNYTVRYTIGNKCELSSKVIVAPSIPTVNFSVTNSCLNISSNLVSTSSSTVGIASQTWTFGDGSANDTGTPVAHTYTSSGTFNVKLVVKDINSCKDSLTKPIVIYPNPSISISSNTVCLNTVTQFSNTTTIAAPDNVNTWAWDFDNNGTVDNTTQTPTFLYTTPGNFTAELKAGSNNGCKDSLTIAVRVNALPTASFTPVNACLNANVVLNNSSSVAAPDNISNYNWSFGANASPLSSTAASPTTLSYSIDGVKTITLDILSNSGCTASITKTVTVYPVPVSNFSATSVCQALQTTFADLSTINTGTISNWDWDFTNDGSIDNTTQNPSFMFPTSGTFTTSLKITGSTGCTHTYTLPVNVWGHTIPNFTPNSVCYGATTTFSNLTNSSTNANTGGVLNYNWDFADGTASSANANPAHTYTLGTNTNAVYNVTLTATSTNNCVDFITKNVNVYAIPTASFTADSVCLGTASHLLDASIGNGNAINNYIWDFLNDGTVNTAGVSNPNFIFPAAGNNAVSYTVSSTPVAGLTCAASNSVLMVYVNPLPVPNFTFTNNCVNAQPNTFDASMSTIAVGSNINYAWAFGDNSNGNGSVVTHTYTNASPYTVTLTVTSNKGCISNIVKAIEVYAKPSMIITNSAACLGNPMSLTATQLANSGTVTNWFWDYNNTITTIEASGQPNVNYVFPAAGSQTVNLIAVSDPGQCRETFSLQVYVDYNPVPSFTSSSPDGCPEHCVTFKDASLAVPLPGLINEWHWTYGDGDSTVAVTNSDQEHCYKNTSSNQVNHYDVKLVVTTNKGCKGFYQKPAYVNIYPTPIAQYTANPNPGNIVTPLTAFTNQSQDFTKWFWNFGDGSPTDSVNLNPNHFYSSVTAQTYFSNLLVKNQYGCTDVAYLPIVIAPEFTFYIPNAFTPTNGDNINDLFTGSGIGIQKYEMWIYDRWGENIFYTDDITKGWDGKVKSKVQAKSDVYTWKVELKDVLNVSHQYIGHVTLLN